MADKTTENITETRVLRRANDVLPLYEALKYIPPGVSLCMLFLIFAKVVFGDALCFLLV